jgi:predicted RNA-binding protein
MNARKEPSQWKPLSWAEGSAGSAKEGIGFEKQDPRFTARLSEGPHGSKTPCGDRARDANLEEKMCLSTVYMGSGGEQKEIMKDVARIEAEGEGFWLIDLFGERTFVEARIQTVSLMDGHFVMLEKRSP